MVFFYFYRVTADKGTRKINVIITGTTGMVGKGVLLECLDHSLVDSVLTVNRKPIGLSHPKLKEIIHSDFYDLTSIKEQLSGYNACFFCLGVSAVGMNELQYEKITFDLTVNFAQTVLEMNPEMIFNYVSGAGTDSSEKGNSMWARVKGKTENTLLKMNFRDVYLFRPGMILPERGIQSSTGWYNFIYVVLRPFFPLFRRSENVTTSIKIGRAMINTVLHGSEKKYLENKDINGLSGL